MFHVNAFARSNLDSSLANAIVDYIFCKRNNKSTHSRGLEARSNNVTISSDQSKSCTEY